MISDLVQIPKSAIVDDLDPAGAAKFLVDHHVPIVGTDMGQELIKIAKRLEVVRKVYDLPSNVEAYRLAIHLVLEIAAVHQGAFCDHLENLLDGKNDVKFKTRYGSCSEK